MTNLLDKKLPLMNYLLLLTQTTEIFAFYMDFIPLMTKALSKLQQLRYFFKNGQTPPAVSTSLRADMNVYFKFVHL